MWKKKSETATNSHTCQYFYLKKKLCARFQKQMTEVLEINKQWKNFFMFVSKTKYQVFYIHKKYENHETFYL